MLYQQHNFAVMYPSIDDVPNIDNRCRTRRCYRELRSNHAPSWVKFFDQCRHRANTGFERNTNTNFNYFSIMDK